MLGKSSEVIDDALLSDWPAVVADVAVGADEVSGGGGVLPDFEGARSDTDRSERGCELIDDAAGDSVTRELCGHCETDRTRTDYEYIW
jgi:hypothetical protein